MLKKSLAPDIEDGLVDYEATEWATRDGLIMNRGNPVTACFENFISISICHKCGHDCVLKATNY